VEGLPGAIARELAEIPPKTVVVQAGNLGNPTSQTGKKAVLARQYLEMNSLQRQKSGRWLQDNVKPDGIKIGYKTWNAIKRELSQNP